MVGAAGRRSIARDELRRNAFVQKACVIVGLHREQARSYRESVGHFHHIYVILVLVLSD